MRQINRLPMGEKQVAFKLRELEDREKTQRTIARKLQEENEKLRWQVEHADTAKRTAMSSAAARADKELARQQIEFDGDNKGTAVATLRFITLRWARERASRQLSCWQKKLLREQRDEYRYQLEQALAIVDAASEEIESERHAFVPFGGGNTLFFVQDLSRR